MIEFESVSQLVRSGAQIGGLALGGAEERLGGEREEQGQEERAEERVEARHAPLCLVALRVALLVLLVLLLLHHFEVEDTRDEEVEQGADDRGNDDPEVREDVVLLAIDQGEEHDGREEQPVDEAEADRLRSPLLLASATGAVSYTHLTLPTILRV